MGRRGLNASLDPPSRSAVVCPSLVGLKAAFSPLGIDSAGLTSSTPVPFDFNSGHVDAWAYSGIWSGVPSPSIVFLVCLGLSLASICTVGFLCIDVAHW